MKKLIGLFLALAAWASPALAQYPGAGFGSADYLLNDLLTNGLTATQRTGTIAALPHSPPFSTKLVLSDAPSITTSLTITSTNPIAFTVGRLGSTTPAFQVDPSAATSITGIRISSQAAGAGVDIVAQGETNVPLRINSAGTGGLFLQTTGTGSISANQPIIITSNSAGAFTVGRQGVTNPAFLVDASAGSSVTGIKVVAAAAAGGVRIEALSSGSNEGINYRSKGTGDHTFQNGNGENAFAAGPNTGGTQANYMRLASNIATLNPFFSSVGTDTNIGMNFTTKGTGTVTFNTGNGGATAQVVIADTASVTRSLTLTGSNGGNPTINVTGGNLAITPAVVGGSYLQTATTTVGSLPACGAGTKGAHHFVTDSNAASYTAGIGAVVAAGGTTNVPVTCDGTNWRIG